MSCFHPNIMRWYAKPGEAAAWHFGGQYHGEYHDKCRKIASRYTLVDYETGEVSHPADETPFVLVPCGQCSGCRIDRSRDWANRMMLEKSYYDDSECWFITLTYDDVHVPSNDLGHLTLVPSDVSRFMKRLRTFAGKKGIRFFSAGEYGTNTYRPHYHLIIFGLPEYLLGLKPFGANERGYKYFRSDLIEKAWSVDGEPLGFHGLMRVTWETCAYTARYVTKKMTGDASEWYKVNQIEPEFCRMSNRPGIGRRFYEDHWHEIVENDMFHLSLPSGGRKIKPPRYFDRLLKEEYPTYFDRVKADRMVKAQDVMDLKMDDFDGSWSQMIAAEEAAFKDKIKSLKRGDGKIG